MCYCFQEQSKWYRRLFHYLIGMKSIWNYAKKELPCGCCGWSIWKNIPTDIVTAPVIDPKTGEIREGEVFVAVLGASSFTYAEAQWNQDLPNCIGGYVRAFNFIGGVSEVVVPDNLKAGVNHPSRYDPDINLTYQEMAEEWRSCGSSSCTQTPR